MGEVHAFGAGQLTLRFAAFQLPVIEALGVTKELGMVLIKEKGGLKLLMTICVVLPVYAHGYSAWKGGFTEAGFQIHLYILPFSVLFFLFALSIHRSLRNRVVVTDSGLLVEDFSKVEFPWDVIQRVSTRPQLLPRGGACLWLVLKTDCDSKYTNRKVRKLNRLIGIDGIPVCNLSTYSGDVERFLEIIEQRAASA